MMNRPKKQNTKIFLSKTSNNNNNNNLNKNNISNNNKNEQQFQQNFDWKKERELLYVKY